MPYEIYNEIEKLYRRRTIKGYRYFGNRIPNHKDKTMTIEDTKQMLGTMQNISQQRGWNDNYFSANHRSRMIAKHGGTMAQVYTVEDFQNLYEEGLI